MKKSRFSDTQILAILKQAESGIPVPQIYREHGISNATFYNGRSKYGGMDAPFMKQLKELEAEKNGSKQRLCRRLWMECSEIPQRSEDKRSAKAIFAQEDGYKSGLRKTSNSPSSL